MTPEESKTFQVIAALEAEGVPYFLAGSFASNYYGIPRSTKDADFVLQAKGGVGESFARRLGSDFELDSQLSFETVTGTHRQYVRHRTSSFKIELFMLSEDAHDRSRFARRMVAELFGRKVWLLSPEDVVVSKLRWGRRKDEEDVFNVLCVQRGKLDWTYIESWCDQHGSLSALKKLRASVPNI
jgi:hypothetical protein